MPEKSNLLARMLQGQPVIPVITLARLMDAVPLARALSAGGLPMIEITLRSDIGLDAIRLITEEVEGAIPGAGTVLNASLFEQAEIAGARFLVSPGVTQELLDIARDSLTPFLPGCVTPSEIMAMQEEGYNLLKFFPAAQAGGAGFLSALAAPLPQMRFCPTGGINAGNAPDYLALPNVSCVGGSWVAPAELVRDGDWQTITALAREAAGLRTRLN